MVRCLPASGTFRAAVDLTPPGAVPAPAVAPRALERRADPRRRGLRARWHGGSVFGRLHVSVRALGLRGRRRLGDEQFFLYCEDTDLCLRLWQAGHAVGSSPPPRSAHRGCVFGAGETQAIAARSRVCTRKRPSRPRTARLEALGVALARRRRAQLGRPAAHAVAATRRRSARRSIAVSFAMRRAIVKFLRRLFPKTMRRRALSHDRGTRSRKTCCRPSSIPPERRWTSARAPALTPSGWRRWSRRCSPSSPTDRDGRSAPAGRARPNIMVSSDALSEHGGMEDVQGSGRSGPRVGHPRQPRLRSRHRVDHRARGPDLDAPISSPRTTSGS